jgi:hypothetical protein
VGVYALWAAAFYYAQRWYAQRELRALQNTVGLLGLCFMVKASATIPCAIVVACVGFQWLAGRVRLRELAGVRSLLMVGVFGLGVLVNYGRVIYEKMALGNAGSEIHKGLTASQVHFGQVFDYPLADGHFTTFWLSQFIAQPFVKVLNMEPTYLNNMLKTMLYGEYHWRHAMLASLLNSLLLIFLMMAVSSTLISLYLKRQRFYDLFPYLVSIACPIGASVYFTVTHHIIVCEDFRYFVPMIVPLAIVYVRAAQALGNGMSGRLYSGLHVVVGFGLPLMAVLFWLSQYLAPA